MPKLNQWKCSWFELKLVAAQKVIQKTVCNLSCTVKHFMLIEYSFYNVTATEVQNIQIGDGDVIRNVPIPIYMVFPRLFTCPTLSTPSFKLGKHLPFSIQGFLITDCILLQNSKSTYQSSSKIIIWSRKIFPFILLDIE